MFSYGSTSATKLTPSGAAAGSACPADGRCARKLGRGLKSCTTRTSACRRRH